MFTQIIPNFQRIGNGINNSKHCAINYVTGYYQSYTQKIGKGPLKCDSCHPISLLSKHYKILAKTLATRLNPFMQSIIHQEQMVFIAGWQLSSNLQRLFNILYSQECSQLA